MGTDSVAVHPHIAEDGLLWMRKEAWTAYGLMSTHMSWIVGLDLLPNESSWM